MPIASANPGEVQPRARHRRRQLDAAVAEEGDTAQVVGVTDLRQVEEDRSPHQDLQQQRHVADELDDAVDQPAHDPVVGEPQHAQHETDDGRRHDAHGGHQQRVVEADPEGVPVARGVDAEVRELEGDVEAGLGLQELEAEGQVLRGHVGQRVRDDEPGEADDADDRQDLVEDRALAFVPKPGRRASFVMGYGHVPRFTPALVPPLPNWRTTGSVRERTRWLLLPHRSAISGTAGNTSGPRWSIERSGRAPAPAACWSRRCARRTRRSCRPAR